MPQQASIPPSSSPLTMAIVTGDRYLDLLARFIEENIALLLDGGLVLKLNPVGLRYVQTRLEALQELEQLRSCAPVDYLRAYVADLGDHRALELLRRVMRLLGAVKVVSSLQAPARDPSPLNLSPFGRLRSLELRGCDLSTTAARGLLELRPVLEQLICHNSADALRHIFAERIVEIGDAPTWTRLTSVSCACNGMLLMDESLQLLPVIEALDLSRNCLSHVANLKKCLKLKFLDLSFNRLQNLLALNQASITITTLLLRNNALCSTNGIERLCMLETLDLSCNIISNFSGLEKFSSLPFLHLLLLYGNPISLSSNYRVKTLSFFPDSSKVLLDGKKMTQREVWEVRRIAASRHEKGPAFGMYALAKRNSIENCRQGPQMISSDMTEVSAEKPKRKISRLAVIQDSEITPLGGSGLANEISSSLHVLCLPNHHSDQARSIMRVSDFQGETSLEKLMNQVEILKREGSISWLRDFNKFMEVHNDNVHFSHSFKGNVLGRKNQKSRQLHRKKKVIRGKILSSYIDGQTNSFEATSSKENFDGFNVFDRLVDMKLSSNSLASPPHYHDNLLQRRQDLEEELLQLQLDAEVSSSSSSDSETSSETSAAPVYDSSTSATENYMYLHGQNIGPSSSGMKQLDQSLNGNGIKSTPEESAHKANALLNGDGGYFLTSAWIGSASGSQKVDRYNINGAETSGTIVGVLNPLNAETASKSSLSDSAEIGENDPPEAVIQQNKKSSKRVRRVIMLEEGAANFNPEEDLGALPERGLSQEDVQAIS